MRAWFDHNRVKPATLSIRQVVRELPFNSHFCAE